MITCIGLAVGVQWEVRQMLGCMLGFAWRRYAADAVTGQANLALGETLE